jgi:hypothetical protein
MWKVKIRMVDESKNLVHVRVVRTDDVTGETWPYSLAGEVNTPQQRQALLQQIKNAYIVYLAREARISATLAGLEATAENALNDWENE